MEELVIQTHDFEEAKNQLKKFAEGTTTDLDLKRVDSKKGAMEFVGDWFLGRGIGTDHVVKGSELNSLTSDIQKHLIDINNMQRSFIGEIGHVYSALEALDEHYIKAILGAIESALKANREAKIAQSDIEKTIEEQKKIVKVLQQFKEKIDRFKHITDIDSLWNDVQNTNETVNSLTKNIEQLISGLEKQATELAINSENIAKITSQEYIYAIDETRKIVNDLKEKIVDVIKTSDSLDETTRDTLSRIEKIEAINHLPDVDSMYDEIESLKESVSNLAESKTELEKQNKDLLSKIEENENVFVKKIKVAYMLAGGAVGLAAIEFVIAIMGWI